MILIDGSEGEGGGQMVRSSLTLSILTGKPCKLTNIRANRPKPGLAAQHLACVRAAAQISEGNYKGGSIGSTVLYFEPGSVKPGNYTFTIGTAGASSLVLHTVYLPLVLRAKEASEVRITGGTHVMASPSFTFVQETWAAYQRKMGLDLELQMSRPGFYPRGGGEIVAKISPASQIRPLQLTSRPELTTAHGAGIVADLPEKISKTMSRKLSHLLKQANIESHVEELNWSNGPAALATVIFRQTAVPTVFVALGERGRPAEAVAEDCVDQALEFLKSGQPVDSHSADQLLLPLVFAEGSSCFHVSEVTQHLRTNIDIIQRFVDRDIHCEGYLGGIGVVTIR